MTKNKVFNPCKIEQNHNCKQWIDNFRSKTKKCLQKRFCAKKLPPGFPGRETNLASFEEATWVNRDYSWIWEWQTGNDVAVKLRIGRERIVQWRCRWLFVWNGRDRSKNELNWFRNFLPSEKLIQKVCESWIGELHGRKMKRLLRHLRSWTVFRLKRTGIV